MSLVVNFTSGGSASLALDYAKGEGKDFHNKDTEKFLAEHEIKREPGLENCRAIAFGSTNGISLGMEKQLFKANRSFFDADTGKNQIERLVQSFQKEELDPTKQADIEKANDLGVKLAQKAFPDFESVVYTHIDNQNHILHNHIIVDKVNLDSGKKMSVSPDKLISDTRKINDDISIENGWKVVRTQKLERDGEREKEMREKGKYVWKDDLRNRINHAIKNVNSEDPQTLIKYLLDNEKVQVVQNKKDPNQFNFTFYGKDTYTKDTKRNKTGDFKRHHAKSNSLGQKYTQKGIQNELTREFERSRINQNIGQRKQRTVERKRDFTSKINPKFAREPETQREPSHFEQASRQANVKILAGIRDNAIRLIQKSRKQLEKLRQFARERIKSALARAERRRLINLDHQKELNAMLDKVLKPIISKDQKNGSDEQNEPKKDIVIDRDLKMRMKLTGKPAEQIIRERTTNRKRRKAEALVLKAVPNAGEPIDYEAKMKSQPSRSQLFNGTNSSNSANTELDDYWKDLKTAEKNDFKHYEAKIVGGKPQIINTDLNKTCYEIEKEKLGVDDQQIKNNYNNSSQIRKARERSQEQATKRNNDRGGFGFSR